jgi:hypothetical protein
MDIFIEEHFKSLFIFFFRCKMSEQGNLMGPFQTPGLLSVCHIVQNTGISASKCQNTLHLFKTRISAVNTLKTQINLNDT